LRGNLNVYSDDLPPSALNCSAVLELKTVSELLIKEGYDINHNGGRFGTPLYCALVSKNVDIVKLLVDGQEPMSTYIHVEVILYLCPRQELLWRDDKDPYIFFSRLERIRTCTEVVGGTLHYGLSQLKNVTT
jgi:hypothetical protein